MRTLRLPRAPEKYEQQEQNAMRGQIERIVLDLSSPLPGTIDGAALVPGSLPSKTFLRLFRLTDWTPTVGNAIQFDGQDFNKDDGRPAETDGVALTGLGEGTWLLLAQVSIMDTPTAGVVTLEMRRGTEVMARAKWNPNTSTVQTAALQAIVGDPSSGERFGIYYVGGPTTAGFVKGGKGFTNFFAVRL